MTIISLTSIPPRFDGLGPVLESLLAQGADAVVLALPQRFRRFDGVFAPPAVPRGVEVIVAEEDFGPACKLLPAQTAFGDETIVICDDDCLYQPGWLAALVADHNGRNAVAGSVFEVARLKRQGGVVAQGFAGVLLPPGLCFAPPPEPCLYADDLWFSALLTQNGVAITPCPAARTRVTPLSAPAPLQAEARAAAYDRASVEICSQLGIWPPG